MKPLVKMQQTLMWLCICPDESSSSPWKNKIYICFTVTVLFSFVSVLTSSVLFIMKFISTNMPESLGACMQVTGWSLAFYMLLIALILRQKMYGIFTGLAEIYNASKYFFQMNKIYH